MYLKCIKLGTLRRVERRGGERRRGEGRGGEGRGDQDSVISRANYLL